MTDRRDEQRAANAAALAAASRARPIVESGRSMRLGRRQLSWIAVVAAALLALAAGWALARGERSQSGESAGQAIGDEAQSGSDTSLRGSVDPPVEKP